MLLQIEKPYVDAIVDEFPNLASLKEQLRLGNKVEVPFHHLSSNELAFLGNLYKAAGPDMQGRAAQLATLQQALNDGGERFDAESLERLMPAIARFGPPRALSIITNSASWFFGSARTSTNAGLLRLRFLPPADRDEFPAYRLRVPEPSVCPATAAFRCDPGRCR